MSVHAADVSFVFRPIERWTGLDRVPKPGPFKVSVGRTQQDLRIELSRIGVGSCMIQADLHESDIRVDGMPYARARYRSSRVVVSFEHPEQGEVAFPCGTYTDLWQNIRAIVMTLEKLRGIERDGVVQRSQQYTGFKTLPAGGSAGGSVGGSAIVPVSSRGFASVDAAARFLIATAKVTMEPRVLARVIGDGAALRRVFTTASTHAHPDKMDGCEQLMTRVNAARDLIRDHQEREGGRS